MGALKLITHCLVVVSTCGCATWMDSGTSAKDMHTITGTVAYRERIALPADAVLSVKLDNVSGQDAVSVLVSQVSFAPQQQVPIPFALAYDPRSVDDRRSYAVRAEIRSGEELLFVTHSPIPVLTRGHGKQADLILVRSSSAPEPTPSADGADVPSR